MNTGFNIVYRLFLVSIIIAMKYHEEYYIENAYFFKQASKYWFIYDIKELNQLERLFLEAIDYRLKIDQKELDTYFDLIRGRSQELQCKKFRMYCKNYTIIEDYFKAPAKESIHHKNNQTTSRAPLVFLNGKFFKDSEELYQFFNCDEICEDKTTFSDNASIYSVLESSPKGVAFGNQNLL